jgi:hypothetical protein
MHPRLVTFALVAALLGAGLLARAEGDEDQHPGLASMLFTQGVRTGIGTFAEAEFPIPWGRRPGLGEQDSGLSEQHWGDSVEKGALEVELRP